MPGKSPSKGFNFRSSVTGQYVKPATAAKKPANHEKERRKSR